MGERMIESMIFYAFAVLTIGFSLSVILLRNPISSALSLVSSFFCVSALFILAHATFLGIVQILIYAGAILVLFLYVLMLLNLQDENWIFNKHWTFAKVLQALSMVGVMTYISLRLLHIEPMVASSEMPTEFGSIESIGKILLGEQVLAFEWISVLLFIGILGVIAICSKKTKEAK